MFKYDWIWYKNTSGDVLNAKLKPMNIHEIISVFSDGKTSNRNANNMDYYPQGLKPYNKCVKNRSKKGKDGSHWRPSTDGKTYIRQYTNYPTTVLHFKRPSKAVHPTQKPVDLLEYLIKTYTNEGETVLDNAAGSMSTVIACINTNRNCIAVEKDDHYYSVGCKRVHDHILENNIDLCYNQVCGGVCLWQSSKTEQVKDMVGF